MAFIKAISYYLPEEKITNELLNKKFPEWTVEKISAKTGIYSRPKSANDEFSSDMAFSAVQKLFNEHAIDSQAIDFILFCTQSPDYFLPTTACILQNRLGLRKNIGALDFNLGCSGFVYGLSLAKGLVDTGMAKNVLLITAETYTKFIHEQDKSNLTIFGDAAAATLITKEETGGKIENFVFGTDGSGAENLIVKQGGLRYPYTNKTEDYIDNFGNIHNDKNLYMNGSEIFNFTIEVVPQLVADVLQNNDLSADEIDLFVFHQANMFMLNHLKKKMKVPDEKFFIHIKECANTVSSTIPIALYEALMQQKINKGNKLLIAGFGVGYSWSGCVINY